MAHDFNNLLTIIRSSTDLLRRPGLAEERRTRYVEAISDTVDRAAKLTGQLLAFAHRQALKPEAFDVGERLRTVTEMLATIVGSRIRIERELPRVYCYVVADVSQFETALVNLAVNARDAMNGEGILALAVDFGSGLPSLPGVTIAGDAFVAISVRDTGVGIPADALTRIFERSTPPRRSQGDRSRAQPGVRLRQAIGRPRRGRQRGRLGDHLHAFPAKRGRA